MDSFENFFSENTISVLISLISLILVVIFQYTIPLVRNNELMKHKLLNVYVPLCKAVNLQKVEFLAKYNEIINEQSAYIPPKLNKLITSYSKEIIKYSLLISSFFAIVLFIALTLKESKARK